MLKAPARVDRIAYLNIELDKADWSVIERQFALLEQEARAAVESTGADLTRGTVRRLADMKYVGQGSEISIALPEQSNADAVQAVFEAAYRQLYGRIPPGASEQFVALRLSFSAPMPGLQDALWFGAEASTGLAIKGKRTVYFAESGFVETTVYDRYALAVGTKIDGPAIGFRVWRKTSAYNRSKILRLAADILRERTDKIARLLTQEQGKPLSEAKNRDHVSGRCNRLVFR